MPRSSKVSPDGDPHLGHDEVDVGDLLGDGVLDLDARVHLDEDVAAVLAEEELDGAGVEVADRLGEAHGIGAHLRAGVGVEVGRRRDLDDLLVAALHRAVALEEVQHGAGGVGEHLHLDVPRVDHGLLEVERRVAEGGVGLALGRLERLAQRRRVVDAAHAAPAAAGDGLDEHREADALGRGGQLVEVGGRRGAVEGGQAGLAGRGDGPRLVAGQVQGGCRGADEGDAVRLARLGEQRVLGEEAVAGVDRVGAALDGHPHDVLVVEVGPHRVALLADLVGLVGLEAVLGPAVLVREDGDRPGAELGGRAERPDGDLPTVGDEDLGEHGGDLPVGVGT